MRISASDIRDEREFTTASYHQMIEGEYEAEVFEREDLQLAIDMASKTFVIVELGAGYGHWSVSGLIKARERGLKGLAIAVEAEPGHFQMMQQHFINNGFDPEDHRLIEAAVTRSDRDVYFVCGHSKDWYGQAILPSPDYGYGNWPQARVETVRGLSLGSIIGDIPVVDLLDMDVQGEEMAILDSNGILLDERVKRVHIATHNRNVEAGLRDLFRALRWRCRYDFSHGTSADTKHGRIKFLDGVQSWVNPNSFY